MICFGWAIYTTPANTRKSLHGGVSKLLTELIITSQKNDETIFMLLSIYT